MNQTPQEILPQSGEFSILFEMLDKEIENQNRAFNFDFEIEAEVNDTISLFKEYKDSLIEDSYATLTKG
jgi:hypothetical protein